MLVNVRDSHKISIFKLLALALVFILGLGLAGFNEALAQTSVIAPREPPQIGRNAPYTVEAVELIANIDGQKAEVLFRQTVVNNSKKPIELDFMAPLPLGGQVSGLTFVSNGKELVGQIYPKDEAFQIYQQIVNRLKDPALLEWAGQGLYRARVFPLEPGKKSTLELSMTYLLPKVDGRVDFIFPIEGPLTQGRTIARQEVVITLNGQGLSGFYSPIDGVTIDQKSSPIRAELNLSKADIIDSFQFHYLMDSGPMGGMVLSHKPNSDEDGFFLFLVEPVIEAQENKPKIPKTVIFVLDRSGSMEGSKFTQAQGGLRFVLERLEPQDSFNLVDFSSQVTLFKPELVTMNDKNRSEAMKYINNLRAGGNTNIEEAMVSAIKQVPIGRPTYIIFLTDGQATTGITKEEDLIEIVLGQNAKKEANIFCFGVGHDVNSRLLDRLASGASGFSTFVEPNQSIEESIASFFRKITSPSLVRPVLTSSITVNRLIPGRIPDIFLGVQSLVVGRYPKGGQTVLTLSGKVGDDNTVYTYQSNLTDKASLGGDFIAQLWAQRRIGQLIEEIDRLPQDNEKAINELVSELLNLSKRYGILTPYTSFLALEDQKIGNNMILAQNTRQNLTKLQDVVGSTANYQRQNKEDLLMSQAPMAAMPSAVMKSESSAVDQFVASSKAQMIAPKLLADKAFFLKDGQMVDGSLTDEDMKNLKTIKRFSQEYYALAEKLGPGRLSWLSQVEPTVFNYSRVNYLIAD